MNLTEYLHLLVCVTLFGGGCSREARPRSQDATWTEHTPPAPRPAPSPEAVDAPRLPGTQSPCEIAERAGRCRLENLSTVEAPGADRELVASYAVLDSTDDHHIEHRARVWYLGTDESVTLAHLRAHPVVACRWQTVVRGSCAAYPGRVEIPEMPSERRRHGHHRRREHAARGRAHHRAYSSR